MITCLVIGPLILQSGPFTVLSPNNVRDPNRLKIIDVVVEGVSILVAQKAEFSSVLRQRGIDGLITILRSQLDRLDAAKAS